MATIFFLPIYIFFVNVHIDRMNLRHVVVLCKLIYTFNSLLTNVIQHIGIRIRNILQICQNMYDFGEISLTCLTKYAIFF
jgi:hypothetical protein